MIPLPAEFVIGDDDQRVLAVRPFDDRLDQINKVLTAFGFVGVAGMLVLLADRLDEADRLERAVLRGLDELGLVLQMVLARLVPGA